MLRTESPTNYDFDKTELTLNPEEEEEMNFLIQVVSRTIQQLNELQWIALLVSRVAIGFFFVMSGYNKFFVQGIGHLREEFIEYGIPFPLMNAWLDAGVRE